MTTTPETTVTHEAYISQIRELAIAKVQDPAMRLRLQAAKLVYGSGMAGTRGVTFYAAWKNGESADFVEVCATGEESDVQLAGTTVHELAHVLAGPGSGHGPKWKAACAVLGLVHAEAGGQSYAPEHFESQLWTAVQGLAVPTDGGPVFQVGQRLPGMGVVKPRPCPMGIGTRGGTSRGTGSGSRLRLWVCQCAVAVKVRVASDDFLATCQRCDSAFTRAESKPATEAA